jgi:thymidylate synthase ThyX
MTRPIESGAPTVTLRQGWGRPYDGAIAAARSCYSPRVIGVDEVSDEQRRSIGPLTFDAGHHTVYQHAHFEFGLENVSRQFVWSFLHAHPFYNSEQSSQRYVRLDEIRAYIPPGLPEETRSLYEGALRAAWDDYGRLTEILKLDTLRILTELRHLSAKAAPDRRRRVEREAEKKAIEVARYVVPVAAFTSLVHTVSGLVLHRLHRLMRSGDAPRETSAVISAMVAQVRAQDPDFFERIGEGPLDAARFPESAFPVLARGHEAQQAALAAQLGGRVSLLVDYSPRAEGLVADAVRAVVGATRESLSDDAALERVLNPALNPLRLETLQVMVHSPIGRVLNHAHYVFLKRLSHTADSQDQRHRMVPASRPLMALTDTLCPDFVTPALIAANAQAQDVYGGAMERAWKAKNQLIELGVPLEDALYLLPNARALRFYESGSLLYLAHKWVQRTCLNAQEEIYQAAMEELEQVREVHPRLVRHIGPPCVVRYKRASPTCTEGDHFCGIPVWRSFPDVRRLL